MFKSWISVKFFSIWENIGITCLYDLSITRIVILKWYSYAQSIDIVYNTVCDDASIRETLIAGLKSSNFYSKIFSFVI